jgi:hypothetical protein
MSPVRNNSFNVLDESEVLLANRTGTPLYELLEAHRVQTPKEYHSRLQTPMNEELYEHEKAVRAAKADFHTHIYYDNNYAQIYNEKRTINTAERLWNNRERKIKDLRSSWTKEVVTATPNNKKALGLTPLRRIGWGQDKAHHIPVSHSVRRLHTSMAPSKDSRVVL